MGAELCAEECEKEENECTVFSFGAPHYGCRMGRTKEAVGANGAGSNVYSVPTIAMAGGFELTGADMVFSGAASPTNYLYSGVATAELCAEECEKVENECTVFSFGAPHYGCRMGRTKEAVGANGAGSNVYSVPTIVLTTQASGCYTIDDRATCLASRDGRAQFTSDPKCCWGSQKFSGGSSGWWCQPSNWITDNSETSRIDECAGEASETA